MRAPIATAVIVVSGFLAAVLSACGDSATNDAQATVTPASEPSPAAFAEPSPTALKSHVVTGLEQARQAGITPYWFGERVEDVGDDFRFTGNAGYGDLANQLPGFAFDYWERGKQPTMIVAAYPPEETLDARRQRWLAIDGATSEPVELSGWSGEIISVLEDDGQFQVNVLLRGEDAAVRIFTTTIEEHILTSPLSDPEQLLAIIDEHLRPFPE